MLYSGRVSFEELSRFYTFLHPVCFTFNQDIAAPAPRVYLFNTHTDCILEVES